ncbi:MAG: hypothetical protein P8Z42_11060 [Anaerolineales bacterium]|jgi:hypothetical protein
MQNPTPTPSKASNKLSAFLTSPERSWWVGLILLAAALSLFTVYDQVFHRVGEEFIWEEQLRFQRWVVEGTSVDPWQYRIFVPYLIEGVREIIKGLGFAASYAKVFFALRLLQNFLIFVAAAGFLRRLAIKRSHTAIALVILAWSFTYSGFQSHLGFDTYFDILFYVLAVYLLLRGSLRWIVPLAILAAFNRETSLFIPFIVFAAGLRIRPRISIEREHAIVGAASLALMVVIIVTVRLIYGPRPFLEIAVPGWDLFVRNLTSVDTYFYLFATFSAVPVIALLRIKEWPPLLVRILWLMLPVWVVIHLFMGVASEARLFLVPYVLVFLPGAFVRREQVRPGEAPPAASIGDAQV